MPSRSTRPLVAALRAAAAAHKSGCGGVMDWTKQRHAILQYCYSLALQGDMQAAEVFLAHTGDADGPEREIPCEEWPAWVMVGLRKERLMREREAEVNAEKLRQAQAMGGGA